MQKPLNRKESRDDMRKSQMSNYEKMFFSQSMGSSKGFNAARPPSNQSQRKPSATKRPRMIHPRDNQYVTFAQESSRAPDKEILS